MHLKPIQCLRCHRMPGREVREVERLVELAEARVSCERIAAPGVIRQSVEVERTGPFEMGGRELTPPMHQDELVVDECEGTRAVGLPLDVFHKIEIDAPAADAYVGALVARTEGWPAALSWPGFRSSGETPGGFVRHFARTHRFVPDFRNRRDGHRDSRSLSRDRRIGGQPGCRASSRSHLFRGTMASD